MSFERLSSADLQASHVAADLAAVVVGRRFASQADHSLERFPFIGGETQFVYRFRDD